MLPEDVAHFIFFFLYAIQTNARGCDRLFLLSHMLLLLVSLMFVDGYNIADVDVPRAKVDVNIFRDETQHFRICDVVLNVCRRVLGGIWYHIMW